MLHVSYALDQARRREEACRTGIASLMDALLAGEKPAALSFEDARIYGARATERSIEHLGLVLKRLGVSEVSQVMYHPEVQVELLRKLTPDAFAGFDGFEDVAVVVTNTGAALGIAFHSEPGALAQVRAIFDPSPILAQFDELHSRQFD